MIVQQILPKLTDAVRAQLQNRTLSEKVNELLELFSSQLNSSKNDSKTNTSLPSATTTTGEAHVNSDKENTNKKRKRNSTGNDDVATTSHTKASKQKVPALRLGHFSKKRRILEPYCFLSSKVLKHHKRRPYKRFSTADEQEEDDEEEEYNDEEDEDWTQSSLEDGESEYETVDDEGDNVTEIFDETFGGEIPVNESTPRNKSDRKSGLPTPIIPVSAKL